MYHFQYTYARLFQEHVCTSSKNIHAPLPRTYMHFQLLIKFVKTYVHAFQEHIVAPKKIIVNIKCF